MPRSLSPTAARRVCAACDDGIADAFSIFRCLVGIVMKKVTEFRLNIDSIVRDLRDAKILNMSYNIYPGMQTLLAYTFSFTAEVNFYNFSVVIKNISPLFKTLLL